MIAKNTKGYGFRGILDYALGKGRILGGNMAGETAEELAGEFMAIQRLRPRLKKAVYHAALSIPRDESLDDDTWALVAERFKNDMGFADSQYIVIRHEDREHEHVHVICNRVTMTGDAVNDSHDYQRQEKSMRAIERTFALKVTIGSDQVGKKALSKGELVREQRTQKPCPRRFIRDEIDKILTKPCTALDFVKKLQLAGIGVRANIASTGKMNGFSFLKDDIAIPASKLGRDYGWKALQSRGVSYDKERDSDLRNFTQTSENRNLRTNDELDIHAQEEGSHPPTSARDSTIQKTKFGDNPNQGSSHGTEKTHNTPEPISSRHNKNQNTDNAKEATSCPQENSIENQYQKGKNHEEDKRRIERADRLLERGARAGAESRKAIQTSARFLESTFEGFQLLQARIRAGAHWLATARRQFAKRITVRMLGWRRRVVAQSFDRPADSDQVREQSGSTTHIGIPFDRTRSRRSPEIVAGTGKKNVERKSIRASLKTHTVNKPQSPQPFQERKQRHSSDNIEPDSGLTLDQIRQLARKSVDDAWEWLQNQKWNQTQIRQAQELLIARQARSEKSTINIVDDLSPAADQDEGMNV